MRKIVIAPKAERDKAVIFKVRKLRAREGRLHKSYKTFEDALRKLREQIEELQKRCPHKRKEWWYGDISEGWKCKDCGVDG